MAFKHTGSIAIPPGTRPGYDHADVYRPAGGKVFMCHTGGDRIDVLDCTTNTYGHAIEGMQGVAGILIDNVGDRLICSIREASAVGIISPSNERVLGRVGVGTRPNGVAYNPAGGRAYSFNVGDPAGTGCTGSVIDLKGMKETTRVDLPGRPRWCVYEAATNQVFVNIMNPGRIGVFGAEKLDLRRVIDVPPAGPAGMAIVGEHVYCAAGPGELLDIDRDSGKVLKSLPLPNAPDSVRRDADKGRLLIAVATPGVVCVIDEKKMEQVETITTAAGAHTMAWNPDNRTLYVIVPSADRVDLYEDR